MHLDLISTLLCIADSAQGIHSDSSGEDVYTWLLLASGFQVLGPLREDEVRGRLSRRIQRMTLSHKFAHAVLRPPEFVYNSFSKLDLGAGEKGEVTREGNAFPPMGPLQGRAVRRL